MMSSLLALTNFFLVLIFLFLFFRNCHVRCHAATTGCLLRTVILPPRHEAVGKDTDSTFIGANRRLAIPSWTINTQHDCTLSS